MTNFLSGKGSMAGPWRPAAGGPPSRSGICHRDRELGFTRCTLWSRPLGDDFAGDGEGESRGGQDMQLLRQLIAQDDLGVLE